MMIAGRILWAVSALIFLVVAFFYPTTARVALPVYPGLLDDRLPADIINIPAMRAQLLTAIALASTFLAGVVLDVAGVALDRLQPKPEPVLAPLLRRDDAGDADLEHLAELGIVRIDEHWTYDGARMADWSAVMSRAIDEGRLRLR